MSDAAPSGEEGEVRLQKRIARSGLVSRRHAEVLIAEGRVSVNGAVVTEPGSRVSPGDLVQVDGRRLPGIPQRLYLALNKPRGYVCSRSPLTHFPTCFTLLPCRMRRVHSVGRLDVASEGLLLVTDDGEFTNHVAHPRYGIPKEYLVVLRGSFPEKFRDLVLGGIDEDGELLRFADLQVLGRERVKVVLTGGRNRVIRRVMNSLRLHVVRLVRVAIGSVRLGQLPVGKWRSLREEEIREFHPGYSVAGT